MARRVGSSRVIRSVPSCYRRRIPNEPGAWLYHVDRHIGLCNRNKASDIERRMNKERRAAAALGTILALLELKLTPAAVRRHWVLRSAYGALSEEFG